MSASFSLSPEGPAGVVSDGYRRARAWHARARGGHPVDRDAMSAAPMAGEGMATLERRIDADPEWLLTPELLAAREELSLLPHLLEESYAGELLHLLRQRLPATALRLRRCAPLPRLRWALKARWFADFVLVSPARMRLERWPAWLQLSRGDLYDTLFKVGCAALSDVAGLDEGRLLPGVMEAAGLERSMIRRLAAAGPGTGESPARQAAVRLSVVAVCAAERSEGSLVRSVGLAMLAGALAEATEIQQRNLTQKCSPRHLDLMREIAPAWLRQPVDVRVAAQTFFVEA